jgi:Response regulator containing CheY-like receiver domain and AraC-type DNA-binding domain
MYKVAIIDDEPIIVEGLSKIIPWERWECEVVATANDGKEGLEVICREKPDILFSDIRMPGMDGLAMIAGMRSEFPDTEVTILTGFKDFEYAKEAIRLGVTRFLSKPSKIEEIEEAVAAMHEKIKQREEAKKEEAAGAETKTETEAEEEHDTAAGGFIVSNAMKFIEENYTTKIKLSDVAESVYVSQWHLSKLLNSYAGGSFSDILNTMRINKAKELLQDPSLRIGDVAEMVGFLDLAHFSRVFKKQTGVSANDFRNNKGNG